MDKNIRIIKELGRTSQKIEVDLLAGTEVAQFEQTKVTQDEIWLRESQSAIAAYNRSVDDDGVFSDGVRGF